MGRYFAVFATDKPEMHDVRERVKPIRRTYLQTALRHGVFVRLGGPTRSPHGDAINGTLLVVEADGIGDVMAFIENDPYTRAGLFERVEVRPWDWSVGNPEQRT